MPPNLETMVLFPKHTGTEEGNRTPAIGDGRVCRVRDVVPNLFGFPAFQAWRGLKSVEWFSVTSYSCHVGLLPPICSFSSFLEEAPYR